MSTISRGLRLAGIACLFLALAPNLSGDDERSVFSEWSAPVNLGPPVNSDREELDPFMSKDGRSLYFASARPGGLGGLDIWVARRRRVKEPWSAPQNLGPTINSPFNDGQPALSMDGHLLFFNSIRPGGVGGQDLFVARRHNKRDDLGWKAAVNLGEPVNSAGNDSGALWFEDEDSGRVTLFLASDRPGGLGGDDLYASPLQSDETFGPPVWLEELSSPFIDRSPAIRRDGLEFLLASDRPGTSGGLDLWSSTRVCPDAAWSRPENLDVPINTEFFDSGPALSFDDKTLIFASALRPGTVGAEGRFDLWMVTRTRQRIEHRMTRDRAVPSILGARRCSRGDREAH